MLTRFYRWWSTLWFKHKIRIAICGLSISFFLVFFWNNIFISIYPGQGGVLWRRFAGTDLTTTYGEGLHVIFPWDKMYVYELRIQELRQQVALLSSNGLLIEVDVSTRYRPYRDSLPRLHQNIGPEYVDKIVEPETVSALRQVLGNYRPDEIYAKDEHGLLREIKERLANEISGTFVNIEEILVTKLMLPQGIQESIQNKLTQEQQALSYEFILAKEKAERERRRIMAMGIREFEEIAGVSMLQWRGIEATKELATSDNAKFIVIGTDSQELPVILNGGQ